MDQVRGAPQIVLLKLQKSIVEVRSFINQCIVQSNVFNTQRSFNTPLKKSSLTHAKRKYCVSASGSSIDTQ